MLPQWAYPIVYCYPGSGCVNGSGTDDSRVIANASANIGSMGIRVWLPLWIGFLATNAFAGPIQFEVSGLGGNLYSYTYHVNGTQFQANEELDIRFDPALYGTLSNGVAGNAFSLLLLQPNNPPGTFGDYSALALMNLPAQPLVFSVTFAYLGNGQPGAQPYYLNLYDTAGQLISTLESGWTTPVGGAVPEPGSLSLTGLALLMAGATWAVRRKLRGTV